MCTDRQIPEEKIRYNKRKRYIGDSVRMEMQCINRKQKMNCNNGDQRFEWGKTK